MQSKIVNVKVWGEFACFTRPECKIERFSYPVPTVTACKGILESVYWHPQITWKILGVQMLNEIQYHNYTTNEIESSKINKDSPYVIQSRQPRTNGVLYKPKFNIVAKMDYMPGFDISYVTKGIEIFNRRIGKGNHYKRPCLGMSDYPAYIDFADETKPHESLIKYVDLGLMLTDIIRKPIRYKDDKVAQYSHTPIFNEVKMVNGYIDYSGV